MKLSELTGYIAVLENLAQDPQSISHKENEMVLDELLDFLKGIRQIRLSGEEIVVAEPTKSEPVQLEGRSEPEAIEAPESNSKVEEVVEPESEPEPPKVEEKPKPRPRPQPKPQPAAKVAANSDSTDPISEFTTLRMALNSEEWPAAVNPELICEDTSDEDKFERAEGIIDLMLEKNTKGLNFLDFGCGEGHIAKKVAEIQNPKISVGYDIVKPENTSFEWGKKDRNCLLTLDWNEVAKNGPYHVVLIYDVIDHLVLEEGQKFSDVLAKIKDVCTEDVRIFVRTHPWCGRHGAHLYKKINKAFAHIVFTEEELMKMGHKPEEFVHEISRPLMTYRQYFGDAGFAVRYENVDRYNVEPFFRNNVTVRNRIMQRLGLKDFPVHQLEQSFVDYVLTN